MGLDTYAMKMVPMDDSCFPKNNLCGGLFSGGGNSFRGKVYNEWVEFVTGVSLYQESIEPSVVKEMHEEMVKFLATPGSWEAFTKSGNGYGITEEETKQLTEWFGVVAQEDGIVVGWW